MFNIRQLRGVFRTILEPYQTSMTEPNYFIKKIRHRCLIGYYRLLCCLFPLRSILLSLAGHSMYQLKKWTRRQIISELFVNGADNLFSDQLINEEKINRCLPKIAFPHDFKDKFSVNRSNFVKNKNREKAGIFGWTTELWLLWVLLQDSKMLHYLIFQDK